MTRRKFLGTVATGAAAVTFPNLAFGQDSDTLRIGLIGCGGRGTDAMINCFDSSPGVELVAMGDVFADRIASSSNALKPHLKGAFKATPETSFVGFDAYQKVLDAGCDMVILATPPGFRPTHFEAAINAGKHVFMEKPVAVDGFGVQKILDASDLATSKGLAVVCGTQRRHQASYLETMQRIHDGAIGDVCSMQCYWNQGGLWMHPRQESWTDMEWQLKNWLYFTWLSGDHICEQHIHNIDVCNWAIGKHPVKAVGSGGRQVRIDPSFGHIFDHFAIEFTYDNGVITHSYCRQQDGTVANVSERIVGTKGVSNANGTITGENAWRRPRTDDLNPYVQEHKDLIASIRSGKPLNEGKRIAETTLTAIMGRLAAYTGGEITWEKALATKSLMPDNLSMDAVLEVPAVAMPGKTKIEDYL